MELITFESKVYKDLLVRLEEIASKVETKQTNKIEKEWLDNQDVCLALRISPRTLQSYRDNGILSFSQHGNKIYYKSEDIKKHLESNYHKAL